MSKPVAEAFVTVLALLNPVTADPIRRCLCSPLMNDKAVYRTAPATPGLLNMKTKILRNKNLLKGCYFSLFWWLDQFFLMFFSWFCSLFHLSYSLPRTIVFMTRWYLLECAKVLVVTLVKLNSMNAHTSPLLEMVRCDAAQPRGWSPPAFFNPPHFKDPYSVPFLASTSCYQKYYWGECIKIRPL